MQAADEKVLQRWYGFKQVSSQPLAYGVVNHNVRVTADGADYVWKRYSTDFYQLEQIRRSIATQERVRQAGLPVPRIVPNAQGELLTITDEGVYVLSEFVQGRHYDRPHIPAPAAYSMGLAMGHVMTVMQEFREGVVPFSVTPAAEAMERMEHLLRLIEPHRGRSALDETAYAILRDKLGGLERMAPLSDRLQGLEAQWVHGDYQETNVLFGESDQVVAVFDFDNTRCRPRGIEVIRALSLGFKMKEGLQPAGYEFVRGVFESVSVTAEEVELYAPLWTYDSLTKDWPIGTRYEHPEIYDQRWDRFIVQGKNFWEENHAAVTERLLQIHAGHR